eukprot:1543276-Prymnesium_polylepis.1
MSPPAGTNRSIDAALLNVALLVSTSNTSALDVTNVTPAGSGRTGGNGGAAGATGATGGAGVGGGEYGKLDEEIVGASLATTPVPVKLSKLEVNAAAVLS